jgi:uncharacterized protein YndB with AHSA1/START domain
MDSKNEKEPFDWSTFSKKIAIKADIDDVYQAFSTQVGLESWFLREAIFNRFGEQLTPEEDALEGDEYHWKWHGWSDDVFENGRVLYVETNKCFAFSFDQNGQTEMVVFITFEEIKGHVLVNLTQSEIPTDEESKILYHVGCLGGWTFYLTNLKSILEGGLDLRNKDLEIGRVINS